MKDEKLHLTKEKPSILHISKSGLKIGRNSDLLVEYDNSFKNKQLTTVREIVLAKSKKFDSISKNESLHTAVTKNNLPIRTDKESSCLVVKKFDMEQNVLQKTGMRSKSRKHIECLEKEQNSMN